MRAVKYSFTLLSMALLLLILFHMELLTYGISQAKGQFSMIYHARNFEEILADSSVADSIKSKMELVNSTKRFAYDSLGLTDTDVYKTVNLEKGKYIMYVLTGSMPFKLTPRLWNFPVVGEVPYKGFFSAKRAIYEKEKVAKQGWDTGIRTAGGWSTLGWFENPLLLEQLSISVGDLVNLTLHEMAHETIYVPGDTDLNENLATFIGDYGTLKYLEDNYGEESDEFIAYVKKEEDYLIYANHFIRGAHALDSMYGTFSEQDTLGNNARKSGLIREIVEALDTITFNYPETYASIFPNELPNNTYFLSFLRYRSDQQEYKAELDSMFQGDLKKYIAELRKRHHSE